MEGSGRLCIHNRWNIEAEYLYGINRKWIPGYWGRQYSTIFYVLSADLSADSKDSAGTAGEDAGLYGSGYIPMARYWTKRMSVSWLLCRNTLEMGHLESLSGGNRVSDPVGDLYSCPGSADSDAADAAAAELRWKRNSLSDYAGGLRHCPILPGIPET